MNLESHFITHERRVRACSGSSCEQGKRKCACPQACELPEDDDDTFPRDLAGAIVIVALLALVAAALHAIF